jgi:uncharacterized membrane protein YesL
MLGGVIGFFICVVIYLIPTIIAYKQNSRNAMKVAFMNVLLGWTMIGYIVALIWALDKAAMVTPGPRN